MWLLLAFVAVPMIEIALFIRVGGLIGLWPTLAIVLLTAMAGSYLVRSQGARELGRLHLPNHVTHLVSPCHRSVASGFVVVSALLMR